MSDDQREDTHAATQPSDEERKAKWFDEAVGRATVALKDVLDDCGDRIGAYKGYSPADAQRAKLVAIAAVLGLVAGGDAETHLSSAQREERRQKRLTALWDAVLSELDMAAMGDVPDDEEDWERQLARYPDAYMTDYHRASALFFKHAKRHGAFQHGYDGWKGDLRNFTLGLMQPTLPDEDFEAVEEIVEARREREREEREKEREERLKHASDGGDANDIPY